MAEQVDVANLVSKLLLDASNFFDGMNKAREKSSGFVDTIKNHSVAIGAALTSVGGLMEHFADPMEKGRAELEAVLQNAGTSFEELKPQIDGAISKMEGFGHTAGDTQEAISRLTTILNDPKAAVADIGIVAEVAAYKHTSLAGAAQMVGRAAQGNGRILKQFGLELENVKTATTEADKAQKAIAETETKAAEATQRLTDLKARQAEVIASRVAAAQQAEASAQDKVNSLQEKASQEATRLTQAQDNLSQSNTKVVDAQQKVQDATQKVADAQDKLTQALSKEDQIRAQRDAANSLADANLSLRQSQFDATDAAKKLQTMQDSGTATAEELARQQLAVDQANQRLVESQQHVSDAQDKANEAAKKGTDQDPAVIAAKKGVQTATDALAMANQGVTAAQDAQQKAQDALNTEQTKATDIGKQLTDAQSKLAAAQQKVKDASNLTVGEQQALTRAENEAKSATEAHTEAVAKNADAQEKLAHAQDQNQQTLTLLGNKLKDIAENQSKTFGGQMDALKAKMEDWIGTVSAKVAPALVLLGPAFTGLAKSIDIVRGAFNFMKEAAVTAFEFLMDNPIVLLIAAVALLAYEIYEHWDTIKRITLEVWGAIWGFISDVWDKIKGAAVGAKDWVVDKWNDIIGFFEGLPDKIANVTSGMWDGIKNSFKAVINWIIDGWNSLHFKMPSFDTHIPGIGSIGGFDIGLPQIPRLALGGITTGPTLAVVGDNPGGREAIVPLPLNGGLGGSSNNYYTINLAIAPGANLTEAGRVIVDAIRTFEQKNGKVFKAA